MNSLNYRTLEETGYNGYVLESAPVRVLQFGQGNFLRAFADNFIDLANEKHGFNGKVVITQNIDSDRGARINEQEGLYTLYLRGAQDGKTVNEKRVISCIEKCINPYREYESFLALAKGEELRYIISNTTEAGIVYDASCCFDDIPPASFPTKLTRFLYERYRLNKKGLIILSCELIDNNGKELYRIVKLHAKDWKLEDAFLNWMEEECMFCSSLVDRIVPGYPKTEAEKLNEENGYIDACIDFGEIFAAWVIEGPDSLREELPFCKGDMPVIVVPDITPYKQRKVRILNGAHTTMVLGAYLSGKDIVRDCMKDDVICRYMEKTIEEDIIPTLTLPKEELYDFASAVKERFANPYIDHQLLSISLNSTSKWRARCLPSFKANYEKTGVCPKCLTMGLACYIAFYHGIELKEDVMIGRRENGDIYEIKDDRKVLEFYYAHKDVAAEELVHDVLSNTDFWDEDLTKLKGAETSVLAAYRMICEKGTYEAMKACV